ncbi:putative endo-1,3(4)-beta-glucanase [Lophiotrema nucula]|uniref:endo-1,3(4)-beta-glucanase n=1 Tax=Lophiotrema nucula TaxID=690887 RepID=A0A6A5YEN1_9PLEO|nr:putative endo-1,3(4)-beta-glucanase [Lophiotrema nucula]
MYLHEKSQATATVIPSSPAPAYREIGSETVSRPSRFNPRGWRWKTWLIVGVVTIVVIIAAVVGGVLGARANAYPNYSKVDYKLQDTYSGSSFFDNFDYFTGYDPAHGFVHYVDAAGSAAQNLTSTTSTNTAILRVDTSDTNATTGRKSVRITSKQTYSTGLFIFDIVHSPYGCATWPALWLADESNWPFHGEIDVMEAVNVADAGNQVTLHTSRGCKIGKSRKRKETGKALSYDCYNGTNSNEGCGVQGPTSSFGEAYNNAGGGLYAMELRAQGIRVWNFPRASLPSDLQSLPASAPDPSAWGTPLADFPNLECDISSHFKNQSIIANIDLCGDWAGQASVFNADAQCTGTCSDWVANEASSFESAFWEFGGFWTYNAV